MLNMYSAVAAKPVLNKVGNIEHVMCQRLDYTNFILYKQRD